jgi:hypothetical protein
MLAVPDLNTPPTNADLATQLLGRPLTEADAAAAAAMVAALAADMQAFRRMPLGDEEPATTYAAVEGEP